MSERPRQLDLFAGGAQPSAPGVRTATSPAADTTAAAFKDPRRALRDHLDNRTPLPLATLQAVVTVVAAAPEAADAAELLCRVCERYAADDRDFGPNREVAAALAGLASLRPPARARVTRRLRACRALRPARLPPLLRAETAALARPDLAPLRACLQDADDRVRAAACAVVADIGEGRLLPELREISEDPAEGPARAALLARGHLGDSAARPALEGCLTRAIEVGGESREGLENLLSALAPVATADTAVRVRRLLPTLDGAARTAARDLLEMLDGDTP